MIFVYVLRCADHSFYVGQTADLESRIVFHNTGVGSRYTSRRRPGVLVHSEKFATHKAACARERQLKRWTTSKKAAFIAGDLATLKALSRRRRR